MFFRFSSFLLIHRPISLFLLFLSKQFHFTNLFRKYVIIIFSLKLEPIKRIYCIINIHLILFNFLISFINNVGIPLNLFFQELHHKHPILVGFFIKKYDTVCIYCFIKYDVFYLASSFTIKYP